MVILFQTWRLLRSHSESLLGTMLTKLDYGQTKALEEFKKQLAQPETVGYFDPSEQTIVVIDASPGVIVQKHGLEYRVIKYASRSLSDVERRDSQTEKEALGIVWGCKRFHIHS